jgi:hypothetical protein
LQVLPTVLGDKDELKTQAHQVLGKLCGLCPGPVVANLEALLLPLGKTVSKKPPTKEVAAAGSSGGSSGGAGATMTVAATGPEAERALDLVKSGLRAVIAMGAIAGIGQQQDFSASATASAAASGGDAAGASAGAAGGGGGGGGRKWNEFMEKLRRDVNTSDVLKALEVEAKGNLELF